MDTITQIRTVVLGLAFCAPLANAQFAPVRSAGALPDLSGDVPTPPTSTGLSINEHGSVVGASLVSGGSTPQHGTEPSIPHAYVSREGDPIMDLGIIEPDIDFVQVWSIANAINDNGTVVGDQNQIRAFAWVQGNSGEHTFWTLPMPADNARAYGINNNDIIVGRAQQPGNVASAPALWRFDEKEGDWVYQPIELIQGARNQGEARDVNEHGQIVGWASIVSGFGIEETSWIHLPTPAFGLPAGTHDMTPGLPHDRIVAINDDGIAVGGTTFFSPTPMIWDPHVSQGQQPLIFTVWPSEITTQPILDFLGAERLLGATFRDINNQGLIVGVAEYEFIQGNNSGIINRAIIFRNGRYSLLDIVAPDTGWIAFETAEGVNEHNQIVGTGIDPDGNRTGFVLSLNDLCRADMQEPRGSVDYFDITEFIRRFKNEDPRADLAEPFGIFNIYDISDYIAAYLFDCGA